MVLEPLDGENEGIFFLSLSRPEARNSIGRQFLRVRGRGQSGGGAACFMPVAIVVTSRAAVLSRECIPAMQRLCLLQEL